MMKDLYLWDPEFSNSKTNSRKPQPVTIGATSKFSVQYSSFEIQKAVKNDEYRIMNFE